MRIFPILFFLFGTLPALSQTQFDSGKISKPILQCARHINEITKNAYFNSIDSLRAQYSHEIWIEMPYASVSELYELTNYPNKYVRVQAFELLLGFKDQVDTTLKVLQKNTGDTLEFVEEPAGDILYKRNVFEQMLNKADEWWKIGLNRNPDLLSPEQKNILAQLKKYQGSFSHKTGN